ncbi:hypothetical protein DM01DRAFT_1337407 [Hesseltinella vesiculosa]|uniref:SNRNP25 ubiquitin-like domain-containing protein n=1 Tax=Hesseltinella vesiculosa TaxID=101127 RepID=A0A1X2GDR3_9FUNG|nr:hypothetical protein DM01DRAFT_1337407 [Hesseltinella vesiculosa]
MTTLDDIQQQTNSLLQDPLLSDVSSITTIEELDLLVALEQHRAFKIQILRDPFPAVDVTVRQSDTVKQLKKAFQTALKQSPSCPRQLNFKHVWQNYCLMLNQQRLVKDDALVSKLGIRHGTQLRFGRR